MYDYLIVGAGLFGATFAYEATKKGKKCLIIDKRNHIGGNIFTSVEENIVVHNYGAHIFHTDEKYVWDYVNQFAEFNRYTNSPLANYHGDLFSLPFNMYTFNKMWGINTPQEAKKIIEEQRKSSGITDPKNLEEQAISLVGRDVYQKLIKGYTEKQWGKKCIDLPSFIIKRLPVRFTYDNNYFNDSYQGIPINGYTQIIEKMLSGIDVKLNCDFITQKNELLLIAKKIVYTGMIDEYYDYCFGPLEYRSLHFETEIMDCPNFQGNAVINYTDSETKFTRIIEHKHFEFGDQEKTVITKEYPKDWQLKDEPYYPVNDEKNNKIYELYRKKAELDKNIIFGGRLGLYRYYDMDDTIIAALDCVKKELSI